MGPGKNIVRAESNCPPFTTINKNKQDNEINGFKQTKTGGLRYRSSAWLARHKLRKVFFIKNGEHISLLIYIS
nr:MAG TPA: hypothetical protein [Caudoviricetes sp.]